VLVQDGTLKVGDVIVCGASFGRVKALYDDRDRPLREAGPSYPVAVVGLAELPQAGDRLIVLDDLQKARAVAEERQHKAREAVMTHREHVSLENLFTSIEAGRVRELQLIVKGDVRGTIDALQKVLGSIVSPEVKLHVLRASVGAISTSDVLLADASDALVVGLNVVPDSAARALAEQKGVAIHTYNVIYRVKEEIERALSGMLKPEERETIGGHAEVRKVFRISRVGNIAGCYVRDGTVLRNHRVRLVRDGTVVFTGRIASLRREKDDIKEAREGFECGIRIEGYDDVKVGDVIETFQIEKIARTLGSPQGGSAVSANQA
jgi:translation initiation factor IF-2